MIFILCLRTFFRLFHFFFVMDVERTLVSLGLISE